MKGIKTMDDLLIDNDIVFSEKKVISENIKSKKNFTLMQARIFYNLLRRLTYDVRNKQIASKVIQVDTTEMKKWLSNGKVRLNHKEYKNIAESLFCATITIQNNAKENKFKIIGLIDSIEAEKEVTTIKITDGLLEYMKLPQNNFTTIAVFEISSLNKINSVKAYEICSLYKNQRYYRMCAEDFYKYFNVKDCYISAGNVRKIIINPIEQDLKKHTKFDLKIIPEKSGRKIKYFLFDININKDKMILIAEKAKTTMSIEEYTTVIEEIKQDEQIINKIDNSDLKYSTDKLVSLILKFDKSRKISQTTYKSWSNDIRKIVEVDGRTYQLVNDIIDYTSNNEYWSKHITSGSSLRSKFDTIVIQSKLNIDNNIKSNKDKKEFLFVLPEEYTSREEYMESYEFDKKYGDNYREYLKKNYPNKKLLLPRFKIYHKGDIDEYIKTEEFKNLYGDECERYKRKKSEVEEYNRKIDIYNAPKNNLKELIKKHKAAKAKSVPPPAWM